MSRFSQSPVGSCLVERPAAPVLRIEYPSTLFWETGVDQTQQDAWGILYGKRRAGRVRLVTARRGTDAHREDATPAGLEKLGIFVTHPRGAVSLTPSDRERFQALASGVILLVIAGTKRVFFVREPGGSIRSTENHREVAAANTGPSTTVAGVEPQPSKPIRQPSRIGAWIALAAAATAIPLLAGPYWHRARPPLALTIREDAGQLRIAWTPAAIGELATLEIDDGRMHRSIPIPPMLSNITYARTSGNVKIRIESDGRRESANYVGTEPVTSDSMAQELRKKVNTLEAQAKWLRRSIALGHQRIEELENKVAPK